MISKRNATKKIEDGPSVLRFKAQLARNSGRAKGGSWGTLEIPKSLSGVLSGMNKVEGTINGHPFRAPIEPNGSGRYVLRVNDAMRAGADAGPGDTVNLAILGPEPEPKEPPELRSALAGSANAKNFWKELDSDSRRIYLRWIDATKNRETRARRVRRTVEQLAQGKRRPCCVNVYEYVMSRVQE